MKFKPMQMVGLAVVIGILGTATALIISVIQGGPPDALSEGAFAVLSAAIGAIAGYSVQDKSEGSPSTTGSPAETDETLIASDLDLDEDDWDDVAEEDEVAEASGLDAIDAAFEQAELADAEAEAVDTAEPDEELGTDGEPNRSGMPAQQWQQKGADDGESK
jgi:hypothetical protein